MNKLLIGLLTLSIAGNAYLLLKSKEVVLKSSEPEKVIVKETKLIKDPELESKYKLALLEIENLKELLKAPKKGEQKIEKHHENVDQIMADLYREKLKYDSNSGLATYQEESIDPVWANKVEGAFQNIINTNMDHDKYGFRELKCKTTTCALKITPYLADGNNNIFLVQQATIRFAAAKHLDMPNFGTKYIQNDETGEVTVYFWQSQ